MGKHWGLAVNKKPSPHCLLGLTDKQQTNKCRLGGQAEMRPVGKYKAGCKVSEGLVWGYVSRGMHEAEGAVCAAGSEVGASERRKAVRSGRWAERLSQGKDLP